MNPKIITVDGPSGVGKGTIAIMIAESLGFKYLDSGSLYRSLALKLFEKNQNFDEVLSNLDYWMSDISIDFKYVKGQKSKISFASADLSLGIKRGMGSQISSKIGKR